MSLPVYEEKLTDEERVLIANVLVAACPEDGVHPMIISILRKIAGCDTVVIAHRAYPSGPEGIMSTYLCSICGETIVLGIRFDGNCVRTPPLAGCPMVETLEKVQAARADTDEVTSFIITHLIRLNTAAIIRFRDSIADALMRPKPWKRDKDLRLIREALDDELQSRAATPLSRRPCLGEATSEEGGQTSI